MFLISCSVLLSFGNSAIYYINVFLIIIIIKSCQTGTARRISLTQRRNPRLLRRRSDFDYGNEIVQRLTVVQG